MCNKSLELDKSMSNLKTIVVIPAYNEEANIADVVHRSLKYTDIVVVVDNNSTDSTTFNAKKAGATIVTCYKPGAGVATMSGIEFVKNLNKRTYLNYIIITLDGDGQHNPEDIPNLVNKLEASNADIVIGSRFLGKSGMPKYRQFGANIITWLYNIGTKEKITDSLCCFRVFNRKAIDKIKIEDDGFGFSTEVLIKARKLGLKIVETPIKCVYHKEYKQNSTFSPIKLGMILILRTLYWRIRLYA